MLRFIDAEFLEDVSLRRDCDIDLVFIAEDFGIAFGGGHGFWDCLVFSEDEVVVFLN